MCFFYKKIFVNRFRLPSVSSVKIQHKGGKPMKAKIMLISMLTAVCIFVFSGATWADGNKGRRHKNPIPKHYTVSKHQRHVIHDRNYRHKPYYRHHNKHRHYTHRPVKKHRHHRYRRPIYSHTDDNVSILASTSHHGWSIKISSRD